MTTYWRYTPPCFYGGMKNRRLSGFATSRSNYHGGCRVSDNTVNQSCIPYPLKRSGLRARQTYYGCFHYSTERYRSLN